MRTVSCLVLSALVFGLVATAAMADDWTAARLRGIVVEFVNGAWQPVHRNDIVPDQTVVRTLASGYVDFTRGTETVSLGPTTQVQIFDKDGAKPFTTVNEAFGTVTVDAEVENVQHFAVETPYLAAVVKGTKFVVSSGAKGASVAVLRGHVEVDDKANKTHTTISAGQSASVGADGSAETGGNSQSQAGGDSRSGDDGITVSGQGVLPPILNAAGDTVGKVTGAVNGLLHGVASGLKGLTGNGNGGDNGNGSAGANANANGNGNGGGGGGLGGVLGGLGLRLGYRPEPPATDSGLWI